MKKSSLFAVGICLFCAVFFSVANLEAAVQLDNCDNCHQEIVEKGMRSRVIHAPFLKSDCAVCHVVGQTAKPVAKKSTLAKEKEKLEKIRWFRDVRGVADEHWILLPPTKVKDSLFVKAWDGATRSPLQSIDLPAVGSLAEMPADLQAPLISDIKVPDVRRGISTSVTISWQTDEFTDAEILYGKSDLVSSKFEDKLSKQHQVLLVGLDANAEYKFQIICRDLFGNRSESDVMSFNTDRTVIEPSSRYDGDRNRGQDIQFGWELFRSSDNYLLVFKADRPISLSLGVQQSSLEKADPVKQEQEVAEAVGHPLLKSQLDTNITICYSCHSSFKDAYSHPINVFPPSGMVVPDDYPLLPDGRISCMSCHSNHGADYQYRLIRDGKKALCRGCHSDY